MRKTCILTLAVAAVMAFAAPAFAGIEAAAKPLYDNVVQSMPLADRMTLVPMRPLVDAGFKAAAQADATNQDRLVYDPVTGEGGGRNNLVQLFNLMASGRNTVNEPEFCSAFGQLAYYLVALNNPLNAGSSPDKRNYYQRYLTEYEAFVPRAGERIRTQVLWSDAQAIEAPQDYFDQMIRDAAGDYDRLLSAYRAESDSTTPMSVEDRTKIINLVMFNATLRYYKAMRDVTYTVMRQKYHPERVDRQAVISVTPEREPTADELRQQALDQARGVVSEQARALNLYQIMPGDKVNVSIWNWYNESARVGPDGYVSLRYIGLIDAGGFTIPELELKVREIVRRKMIEQWEIRTSTSFEPIITVTLDEYKLQDVQVGQDEVIVAQQPKVTVVGEVYNPGEYQAWNLVNALSMAGGQTRIADMERVLVLRTQKQHLINFQRYLDGDPDGLGTNIGLKDGDIIIVRAKWYERAYDYWEKFNRFFGILFSLERDSVGPLIKLDL